MIVDQKNETRRELGSALVRLRGVIDQMTSEMWAPRTNIELGPELVMVATAAAAAYVRFLLARRR